MLILKLILIFFNLVNCIDNNNNIKDTEYYNFINKPSNILISLYIGTRSHIKFMLEINQHLKNLGHNITLATAEENFKWADGFNITLYSMGRVDRTKVNRENGLASVLPSLYDQFYPKYPKVIEQVKPDLVICDFFSAGCIDYCQENNIPLIIGLQALDSRSISIPYINDNVNFNIPTTTENMGFWSRWYNTFIRTDSGYKDIKAIRDGLNKIRSKYGISPKKGRWGDFDKTYKLLNTYFGWEVPRPLHPTFDLIGPIRSTTVAPLTDELKQFLNHYTSTLYIAFGSRITPIHKDLDLIIKSSFLALNQGLINGVILATIIPKTSFPEKFETVIGTVKTEDLFNGKYPEFKVAGFVPQESILKHKSTKLFISHGGLESMFETIFTQTPVLVIPFSDDQPANAQLVVENNLGGMIDKNVASSDKIFEEIKRIMIDENDTISRNLKRVGTIAHYKSVGIEQAAHKILSFLKISKACRIDKSSRDDGEIPCEVKHMITVDQKISKFKAYQWDIYLFQYSLITLLVAIVIHVGIKIYFKFNKGNSGREYRSISNDFDLDSRSSHDD